MIWGRSVIEKVWKVEKDYKGLEISKKGPNLEWPIDRATNLRGSFIILLLVNGKDLKQTLVLDESVLNKTFDSKFNQAKFSRTIRINWKWNWK